MSALLYWTKKMNKQIKNKNTQPLNKHTQKENKKLCIKLVLVDYNPIFV